MSAKERVTNKVKEVANQDFTQAKELANDAFRSAAYLYPFKVCNLLFDALYDMLTNSRGHRLLSLQPHAMEATRREARADHVARTGRDGVHVCCNLRSSSRDAHHLQWTPGHLHHHLAGA